LGINILKLTNTEAPISPILALAFGILAVSTASIFIRFAQQDAPSLTIAALRLIFASLVLAPLALFRKNQEMRGLSKPAFGLLFLSGLFLAFHFATWITSLEYTSVASSVVLVQTTPLWVALFSFIFLRERISRYVGIGLALALAGGAVVGMANACRISSTGVACESIGQVFQGRALLGNSLALAGAIFASGYLIIGRRMRASLSLTSYTFIVYGSSAVILLIAVLFARQPLTGLQPNVYLWCLALALIPQLLGHSSFNWALGYLSTTFVSIALLGEPVGSIILAFLILKQSPSALELTGGVLILAGIYMTSLSAK
jgi:drug/metabolite transporter (DMT)-like permease